MSTVADKCQQRFLSTRDFTAIFIEFDPQPYTFVTTLKGFVFLGLKPEQTEAEVNGIVADTLFEGVRDPETTMQVRRFLATYRDNVPDTFRSMDDTVKYLRKTIVVEHLELVRKEDIGTGGGKAHSAWNIYISPPTRNHQGLREWRSLIRKVSFVTPSNSAGRTYKIFRCSTCRSESHPGGMCRLPDQPGWKKPPPTQAGASTNTPGPSTAGHVNALSNRGGRGIPSRSRGRPTGQGRGRGSQRA